MKKLTGILGCIFLSLTLFSQKNYKPGLIVLNNGDTVRGQINYLGWQVNPSRIDFLRDGGATGISYGLSDLQSFTILGEDSYLRAVVKRDMRPVRIEEISEQTKDEWSTDTAFLRILVRGSRLTLYQLVDKKEHYYLQEGEGKPEELLYKIYASLNATAMEAQFIFRDQLKRFLPDPDKDRLSRRIERAYYTETDLTKIVAKLNGEENGDAVSHTGKAGSSGHSGRGSNWAFFAMGGVGISRLSVGGDPWRNGAVGLDYNNSADPMISVGADLQSSRSLRKISLRFELGYSKHSFTGRDAWQNAGHEQSGIYVLKFWNLNPALSVLYNFHQEHFTRYYAGVGVSCNISHYTTNRYVMTDWTDDRYSVVREKFLFLQTTWPAFFLEAGTRIGKHLGLDGKADLFGSVIRGGVDVSVKTYAVKLAYYFK